MLARIKNLAVRLAPITMAAVVVYGCGDENIFSAAEKSDPAEDAVIALEKKDPNKAISVLEGALLLDPGNPRYLSILSTAFAQRAGIEPLRFASKVAENGLTNAPANSTGFSKLYAVVPVPGEQVLADINRAVSILAEEVAIEDYQSGDRFKLGLFQTASMVLRTKSLDRNGDGRVSADELLELSAASAIDILSQLQSARAVLASAGADEPTMQKAAEALTQFQEQIDASPGANAEERLKNFIASATGGASF